MHTYVLCVFTQHNVSTTDFQHVCHPQRGWVSDDIQDHCTSFVVGSLAGGLSQSVPQWPFGCTHCKQCFIAPYPLGCLGAYTPQSGEEHYSWKSFNNSNCSRMSECKGGACPASRGRRQSPWTPKHLFQMPCGTQGCCAQVPGSVKTSALFQ